MLTVTIMHGFCVVFTLVMKKNHILMVDAIAKMSSVYSA